MTTRIGMFLTLYITAATNIRQKMQDKDTLSISNERLYSKERNPSILHKSKCHLPWLPLMQISADRERRMVSEAFILQPRMEIRLKDPLIADKGYQYQIS